MKHIKYDITMDARMIFAKAQLYCVVVLAICGAAILLHSLIAGHWPRMAVFALIEVLCFRMAIQTALKDLKALKSDGGHRVG